MARDAKLESTGTENEIENRGSFYYKYRYLESKHTNNVERTELERIVTNKLRNISSDKQSYALNLDVSQSWSVSPSVSGSFKDTIKVTLGGSCGNECHKIEYFTVNVVPNKTVWVTFIPIMDKSCD